MDDELARALEAADPDAVLAALTEDVTLRVAVHDEAFVGRAAAAGVLRPVLAGALYDIEVTEMHETGAHRDAPRGIGVRMIAFRARVAGHAGPAEGLLLARTDGSGRAADLTVYLRPLPALQALADEMGRRLGAA